MRAPPRPVARPLSNLYRIPYTHALSISRRKMYGYRFWRIHGSHPWTQRLTGRKTLHAQVHRATL
jgi:hypothetical protein